MAGKRGLAAVAVVLAAAPFVALQEGVRLEPYADPVGIPTVCVGETDRAVIGLKAHFSREECMAALGASLMQKAAELDRCVHVPLTDGQAVAVLSFGYNVGTQAACGSTFVKRLNAGEGRAACAELSRWVYARGIKLPGLVKRRAAERARCEA